METVLVVGRCALQGGDAPSQASGAEALGAIKQLPHQDLGNGVLGIFLRPKYESGSL